jgi:ribosomal protein S18 acetylase RimI-like enzyme
MSQSELTIRPFHPHDSPRVHRIAADTAFFGQPVEVYLEDRGLFIDAFYRYYTSVEANHGWVACAGEEVVGFLMGCTDTPGQGQRWRQKIFPAFASKLLSGRYSVGRLTLRYAAGLALAGIRGEIAHADTAIYPAHLHINIDSCWRSRGLGRRLIEAYLAMLRSQGIRGVHLSTTDMNGAACRLYEKIGFTLVDARHTHLWMHWTGRMVETRAYGLKL